MNRCWLPLLASPLLIALILSVRARAHGQDGPVAWRTDFAQARAEARAKDKPLFVVFR